MLSGSEILDRILPLTGCSNEFCSLNIWEMWSAGLIIKTEYLNAASKKTADKRDIRRALLQIIATITDITTDKNKTIGGRLKYFWNIIPVIQKIERMKTGFPDPIN